MSDWDAASLSLQPSSTDTVVSNDFSVYSRYGLDFKQNENDDDVDDFGPKERCKNGLNRPGSNSKRDPPSIVLFRPSSGSIQQDPGLNNGRPQPLISISEDGQFSFFGHVKVERTAPSGPCRD